MSKRQNGIGSRLCSPLSLHYTCPCPCSSASFRYFVLSVIKFFHSIDAHSFILNVAVLCKLQRKIWCIVAMVIAHLATAMCGLVKTLNFYKITFQLATLVQPFSVKLHVKLTSTKLPERVCVCVSKGARVSHTYTDKYLPIVLY